MTTIYDPLPNQPKDCCAVCGEQPATVIRMLHWFMLSGAAQTTIRFRLCGKCEPAARSYCGPYRSLLPEPLWESAELLIKQFRIEVQDRLRRHGVESLTSPA